ncbi:MAG: hypothetical protein GQ565_11190 [Candidatus Aegiribacteria sp.]|nr:hypothetical protein [Candidatus Aegiribacteria sp.]
MTLSLTEARRLDTYLKTAIQLDGEIPQYKLLLAMLKRDYFETNGMRVPPPNAAKLLAEIDGNKIDKNEVDRLRESVKVSRQDDYLRKLLVI